WGIPAKEVGLIAAHVLRARIAQAGNELDGAIRELEAAVALQDALPYMEPPYWYYPLRQTLGALLLLKGDAQRARDAFRESLARTRTMQSGQRRRSARSTSRTRAVRRRSPRCSAASRCCIPSGGRKASARSRRSQPRIRAARRSRRGALPPS